MALSEGVSERITSYAFLRFFIRQLYGTAGLAAALSRVMPPEDDK
jgi:hypothetical protein